MFKWSNFNRPVVHVQLREDVSAAGKKKPRLILMVNQYKSWVLNTRKKQGWEEDGTLSWLTNGNPRVYKLSCWQPKTTVDRDGKRGGRTVWTLTLPLEHNLFDAYLKTTRRRVRTHFTHVGRGLSGLQKAGGKSAAPSAGEHSQRGPAFQLCDSLSLTDTGLSCPRSDRAAGMWNKG